MDAFMLARMQFAASITFHILFPTISIALGWVLLFFRWRWLKSGALAWLTAYRFWTKVFALTFALGVVSGITMSFQFGTNWPGFLERAGNIAGPLLGYAVLTAFFLEAGFLGVMLFGHGRVSELVHLGATLMVAFGTTLSAFWILSLNSWMQTPQGFEIIDGEFHALSWMAVIFNPSSPYRLAHKLLASGLTVAFILAGVSAWQLLKGKVQPHTSRVHGLLGAGWLLMKTEDELQARALSSAKRAWPAVVLGLALISLTTPWISPTIRARWFVLPELFALLPIPLISALALLALRALLNSHRVLGKLCWLPFALTVLVMLLAFFGLAYSLYPSVMMDRMTIWQAAAAPKSLQFILVGCAITVPVILAYTVLATGYSGARPVICAMDEG